MTARGMVTGGLLILVALAVTPDPQDLWNDTPLRRPATWLDPSLRVPFASILLRAPAGDVQPEPGARVLGLRLPGDDGLLVPRQRAALLEALAALPVDAYVELLVQGVRKTSDQPFPLREEGTRRALFAQWPTVLAGTLLLLFAGICAIGGQHPVATPLAAVTACLGVGLLAALDLVLPGDRGLLGIADLKARMGVLAWSALPAALLHLAARFPVTMPRFRRPAMAMLPWALWVMPAALAQLRFDSAAVVHAVERVALTASFLAGGILIAGCLWPGRRLSPIERFRARAATIGLALAGGGPLLVFLLGMTPGPGLATTLSLSALGLPIALGWAVVRYRLLDPPIWLAPLLLAGVSAAVALGVAAVALHIAGLATRRIAPPPTLALATALLYHALHTAFARGIRLAAGRRDAPEALVARAGRELAAAPGPDFVLSRLAVLLRSSLGASAVEVTFSGDGRAMADRGNPFLPEPRSPLLRRAVALCAGTPAIAGVAIARVPRCEDPDPRVPEVALRLEPRGGPAAFVAVAPRPDGLPYAPEELRALGDAGRLATLALTDALDAARLEALVLERTVALRRALADRTSLVAAAQQIQVAGDARAVRAAAASFLAERSSDPARPTAPPVADASSLVIELCRLPLGRERLTVDGLTPERVVDLQPQADTVGTLACLAIERLHLLDGLEQEVEYQARELARITSDQRNAEFVRRVAHELRKPGEEIRQLIAALAPDTTGAARVVLDQIESAACEMARRLDTLLSRQGRRLDSRRVDLVRLAEEAMRRVSLVRSPRHFLATHRQRSLPLLGDPVRLVSLIENLLDNAARATGEAGRIELRSELVASDAGRPAARVLLEVEDDGEGIPSELAEEIFEPGVGTFGGGFGLGLALCRDVVSVHRGDIAVESRPGRTVFRVLLPQWPDGVPT